MKQSSYIQYRKDYCEKCGVREDEWTRKRKYTSPDALTAHHKDLNHENNQPENIMTLCRKCHTKVHQAVDRYCHGAECLLKDCPHNKQKTN